VLNLFLHLNHWGSFKDGYIKKLKLELGDVLWYLNRCAIEIGSSLEEIAALNIEKLNERKEAGTIMVTEKRSEENE